MSTVISQTEPPFVPKPGQVDYTHIRYCPVINCVVMYDRKFLIVRRSSTMRLYPGYWNGISGFLDDQKSVEEKVYEELREELGISKEQIASIRMGGVFHQDEPLYKKTWIVHPILVTVRSDRLTLDWEAETYAWVEHHELDQFNVLPGFDRVVDVISSLLK